MVQQLNLLADVQRTRRDLLSAGSGLLAMAAVLALSGLLAAGLQWHGAKMDRDAPAPPPQLAVHQEMVAALAAAQTEVQRLRALDEQQQRVHAALSAGMAGSPEGYTPYLRALSRQARSSLWITGFALDSEATTIELQGRMTEAAELPAYLQRLNAEALFQGRPFAQLQIRELEQGGDAGRSEFALRSTPIADRGAK